MGDAPSPEGQDHDQGEPGRQSVGAVDQVEGMGDAPEQQHHQDGRDPGSGWHCQAEDLVGDQDRGQVVHGPDRQEHGDDQAEGGLPAGPEVDAVVEEANDAHGRKNAHLEAGERKPETREKVEEGHGRDEGEASDLRDRAMVLAPTAGNVQKAKGWSEADPEVPGGQAQEIGEGNGTGNIH